MNKIALLSISLLLNLGLSESVSAENNKVSRSGSDIKRDVTSKPHQILGFLGVNKGDTVLDFLAGDGYYRNCYLKK